jgi:hypothetical protein
MMGWIRPERFGQVTDAGLASFVPATRSALASSLPVSTYATWSTRQNWMFGGRCTAHQTRLPTAPSRRSGAFLGRFGTPGRSLFGGIASPGWAVYGWFPFIR